jgi:hypothetical protein
MPRLLEGEHVVWLRSKAAWWERELNDVREIPLIYDGGDLALTSGHDYAGSIPLLHHQPFPLLHHLGWTL